MKSLVLTLIMLLSTTIIFAQNYTLVQNESEVAITGTSTVHDWESIAETYKGEASIKIEDGKLVSVDNLKFIVEVESIKSGKSGMDKKTYGALNQKKFPYIEFNLTEISEINSDTLTANGDLSIAGTTNKIRMEVAYEVLADGSVKFQGNQPVIMTEYNVSPPSAMLGTIRAGDEIKVKFDTKFAQ
ncbi:MAG: YceI family protein [Balneolaceae bacterium]